jgi:GTPase SAR1 family protein
MSSTSTGTAAGDGVDLWTQILRESSRQSSQLPPSQLLLLGDRNCGKTSVLIKLQQRQAQTEQLAKGVALDYSFLDIQDDASDGML